MERILKNLRVKMTWIINISKSFPLGKGQINPHQQRKNIPRLSKLCDQAVALPGTFRPLSASLLGFPLKKYKLPPILGGHTVINNGVAYISQQGKC